MGERKYKVESLQHGLPLMVGWRPEWSSYFVAVGVEDADAASAIITDFVLGGPDCERVLQLHELVRQSWTIVNWWTTDSGVLESLMGDRLPVVEHLASSPTLLPGGTLTP
ncbi:hypothetical protein [Blastococcus saxobsidens]|uniref:hypothetical protein n=1 Tax=Blastococcus saxobsidens TaxID=138336 RepID=UPI000CEC157D|nr:hypothetical protein [Blastococcus saxobsidens]